jgi:mannitol-specific phosphotransferase system IIBC component
MEGKMKKLLSVLFAAVFALTVSGFAFAADNAAMPPKAEKAEKKEKKAKATKKAKKKAAKKDEKKDEMKKEMAPAPDVPPVKK